jgi:hypothetical protein
MESVRRNIALQAFSSIQNVHRKATAGRGTEVKKKTMKRPKEKSYVQKNN